MYSNILVGKSGKRYEHGIPPQEIKDKYISSLIKEGKEKLPKSIYELLNKSSQILIQPIYDLISDCLVNDNIILVGDCAFTARPHVGMGVTKAALDCLDLMNTLSITKNNNMNLNLKDWEKKRIKEGLFLVNRSREMGSYLTYNKVISMPSYNKVLEETAVSIKHIANYPNKII